MIAIIMGLFVGYQLYLLSETTRSWLVQTFFALLAILLLMWRE